MDALEFLNKSSKSRKQPIYVLTGDEDFLKRRVMEKLQPMIVGEADPSFAVSNYAGDKAEFSTIRNELDTIPFLCDCRLVIVDQADPFVSKFRAQLEKYVAAPAKSGVLILDVKSWPSNTKLAKQLPEAAIIICKAPAAYKLPAWCVEWAKSHYQKTLAKPAAELLVELVGAQMGILDQELKKLSDFVGEQTSIQAKEVDLLVGRSRSANVFKIMDAIGNGKPAEALNILSELLEEGEEPLQILGALGHQLRRLVQSARHYELSKNIDDALDKAGIAKWPEARESAKKQLRHLGGPRIDKIYDWLLEVDLGLKGGNPLSPQLQMERLIVNLARPKETAKN